MTKLLISLALTSFHFSLYSMPVFQMFAFRST